MIVDDYGFFADEIALGMDDASICMKLHILKERP